MICRVVFGIHKMKKIFGEAKKKGRYEIPPRDLGFN